MMDSNGAAGKAVAGDNALAKNTGWNLAGLIAPVPVAVFAIPPLISGLGVDRFGLLTIAWAVIGYFSLFDFGIGRALTQLLAERLGSGKEEEAPALIGTSLALLAVLGAAGGALLALLSPWIVGSLLKVPAALAPETLRAFTLLGVSVPVVTTTAGLRGVLEAKQRFFYVNLIRMPMGVFTLLGPLCVLPFSNRLDAVVAVLLAGRVIFCLAHSVLCERALPGLSATLAVDGSLVRPLIRFGGWMTVSNVVSPLMTNLDRLFIGSLISVSSVAYYATPQEMITKLTLIPGAIVGVLFPAFSAVYRQDPGRARRLFRHGVKQVFLAVFPLTLVAVLFAHEGLSWWLGSEFAAQGGRVLQWLALGVFINSLAYIPFALIQGAGRPDITGKLQLILTPVYLSLFLLLVRLRGIEGAAIAWTLRVTVEAVFLFGFARGLLPRAGTDEPFPAQSHAALPQAEGA